jgi:hypothetical protein
MVGLDASVEEVLLPPFKSVRCDIATEYYVICSFMVQVPFNDAKFVAVIEENRRQLRGIKRHRQRIEKL